MTKEEQTTGLSSQNSAHMKHLAMMFDLTTDAIFLVHCEEQEHYRIVAVNRAALEMTGYKREQLLGRLITEIWSTEAARANLPRLREAVQKRTRIQFEHRQDFPTGDRILEVSVIPIFDEEGSCTHMAVVNHDITQYKQLQQALTLREAEMRATLYSIGDAVISTDLQGRVRVMNPVAEQLTGWKEAEAQGKPLTEVFHIVNEHTRAEVENPFARVLREGTVIGLANHTLLIARNGRERPIADAGAPVRNPEGDIIGVVLVFRDQSAERQAQQALQESESFLKESQRIARLGHYVLDVRSGQWTSSETLDEIFGITKEHPHTVEGWLQIVHPEDREEVEAYYRQVLQQKQPFDKTYRIRRVNDGQERWMHGLGKIEVDAEGVPVWMFGTVQDITERVQTTQALRESEERYRSLVDTAAVGIAIHQDGRWVFLSQPALKLLGYEKEEELLGKPVLDVIHPEDRARAAQRIREMVESGHVASPTIERLVTRSGEVRSCLIAAAAITYRGRPAVQVTAVDITDRIRAEQELKQRASEMAALHALTLELTSPVELQAFLESVVRGVTDLLDGSGGGLYLCDPARHLVRCVVSYKTPRDYTGVTLAYGEGAAGQVATTGEPLIINDYRTWPGRAQAFEEEKPFRAVMSAPVIWQGAIKGVIHVLRDEDFPPFESSDLDLLTIFANHAAIAMENARLLEQIQHHAQELEEHVQVRTEELRKLVHAMAGREIRMSELKEVILKLRKQLQDAGLEPVADDPLFSND